MNSIRQLCFIAIVFSSVTLVAQYQVNNRVDNSLYGAGSIPIGSVKYGGSGTSIPMPSEVRNAYYKSGALPSDIKMNRAAQGPLTPNGAIDYIPKGGQINGVDRGGPGFRGRGRGGYNSPSMMPAYNTGSIRRSTAPPSPNQALIAPKQFNSAIAPTKFH